MSVYYEIILNYLRNQVKGRGSVFWKRRICRELELPEDVVTENLEAFVEDGYLTKQWIFIDARDEDHLIEDETAEHALKTGEFYHPDTLEPVLGNLNHYLREDFLATKKLSSEGYFRKAGWHSEDVYVIRTDNIDKVKDFFTTLGLSFKKERHGKGPEHYACDRNGKVLEIYPHKTRG